MLFSGTTVSAETDKYLTKFGPEASEYPDVWRNPYAHVGVINHTWTQEEKDTLIADYSFTARDDFPTSFEKNIYQSGRQFLQLKNEGVNVVAVTSPYQEGTESWQISFNAASNAFKDWFELNIGDRYESSRNESFINMLDDIESELVYLVGKGTITDIVDSRFEVIPNTAQVLLNGTALAPTQISSNEIGFGTPDNSVYQYVYRYSVEGGKEVIRWDINKEARVDDLLQFKFGIKLITLPTTVGVHTLETNESANIEYLSSKEVKENITDYTKTQSMPSPTIQVEMAQVISNFVDEDGNILETQEVFLAEVGDAYSTAAKTISGYTLLRVDGTPTGNLVSGTQVVNYVYSKDNVVVLTGTVISKYVDEDGVEIASSDTFSDEVGKNYQTSAKTIQGYTLQSINGQETGKLIDGTITVSYVYSKLNDTIQIGRVISKYVDEDGIEIASSDTFSDEIGKNYKTTAKTIQGYLLKSVEGNQEGVLINGTITVIYVYSSYTEDTTLSIGGIKTWVDGNNQDGIRPQNLVLSLYADGLLVAGATPNWIKDGNVWTYEFTNLPKFKDGKTIEYTVTEESLPGYTATNDGFNFTNTHIVGTIVVNGTKTWVDDHNAKNLRPNSIEITLFANNREVHNVKPSWTKNGNVWNYEYSNLPAFKDGVEINYTVVENPVDNYKVSYKGLDITNTLIQDNTELPGTGVSKNFIGPIIMVLGSLSILINKINKKKNIKNIDF